MGYLVVIGRELGSSQQVFKPLALLFGREGIKEIRRLFGPPKFSDAVEREDGVLHLRDGRADKEHGTLREFQLFLRGLHSLSCREAAKRGKHDLPLFPDRQPDLPPQGSLVFGWKCVGSIRPECAEAGHPDLTDGVDETLVVSGVPGSVASLCQVVADEALEVIQLPVGDEDGGVRAVPLRNLSTTLRQ